MISVRHIYKTFETQDGKQATVLRDVSCDFRDGETVSIIGASGVGKSTLLRVLNMLIPPTSGEIYMDGEEVTSKGYPVHRMRQRMGMVFQSFALFPHLTVLENVTLAPMKLKGLSREEAEADGMEMLRKVGMAGQWKEMPTNLSGGQQQRTAIARTLAMKPEIILLDEPTSALDPTMVAEVQGVLQMLSQEKMTMIIVTHKMQFARDISQRVLFMHAGTIHEDGTPEQIFGNPQRIETQTFVHIIRRLTFDITSYDFDFYDITSRIKQFCIRYAMPDKMDPITHVVEELLVLMRKYNKPIHIEVTYSELDYSSTVVIVHKGETISPLEREDADELAVMIVQGMSDDIQTEQTPEGVKLTFKMK